MKNAGLAGVIALCGIGLIMIGLGSVGSTPAAMGISSDDLASASAFGRDSWDRRRPARRGLDDGCSAPGAPVTWPVFDPELRPLEVVTGSDQLPCWSGTDSGVDLDGDGSIELANSSGGRAGVSIFSDGEFYITPFSVLRRRADGVAVEVVLEFQVAVEYWRSLLGPDISDDSSIFANVRSFFDVDGDGLRDAVLRVSYEQQDGSNVDAYYWYRNQLPPPSDRIAGDVNADGSVNGADLTIVLSDWTG